MNFFLSYLPELRLQELAPYGVRWRTISLVVEVS
jgi:hypothetical protein